MKTTGLKRYAYNFCISFDIIIVGSIQDTHNKYLMEKQYCIKPRSIKEMFIGLELMLCFHESSTIKCVSMSNQPWSSRPTLIDLRLDDVHYYPLIISVNRCDESFSSVEDPFSGTWVPSKIEDVNLKVVNMIKGINEFKYTHKTYLLWVDATLMVGNVARDKNGTMISANVTVKNQQTIAHVKKIITGILITALASVIKIIMINNNNLDPYSIKIDEKSLKNIIFTILDNK